MLLSLSVIASCDDERHRSNYVLKEVIDVQGTCWEDHVGQRDNYAGQIVRWQNVETGKSSTYGFLYRAGDWTQQTLDEVSRPTVYHTPQRLEFLKIDVDTSQPKWVLHGISGRGEDSQGQTTGYDSTCDLNVVKRGMEIRAPDIFQNAPTASPANR
jgi:hypothetical protein